MNPLWLIPVFVVAYVFGWVKGVFVAMRWTRDSFEEKEQNGKPEVFKGIKGKAVVLGEHLRNYLNQN